MRNSGRLHVLKKSLEARSRIQKATAFNPRYKLFEHRNLFGHLGSTAIMPVTLSLMTVPARACYIAKQ